MTYLITKFWTLAALGWVLFVGTTYLWRRAAEQAKEQRHLRHLAIKLLRQDIQQANEQSFHNWLKREVPQGVEIFYITGGVPVFAEGKVDGFEFYFRARGNRWHFEIAYEDDPSYSRGSLWRMERRYGSRQFAASWMPQTEALAFILECAFRFREHQAETAGQQRLDL